MNIRGVLLVVLTVFSTGGAAQYVDPIVQTRMLELIRDTAMTSSYAERQLQALTPSPPAPSALQHAARELRRLGMKIGNGADLLVVEWRGRSMPEQVVLVTGLLPKNPGGGADARALAIGMGMLEAFTRLQLKPRRTVRLIAMAEEEGPAALARYRDRQRADLGRHAAVIEVGGNGVNGLRGLLQASAAAQLDPARLALRSIHADRLLLERTWSSTALAPLASLGIPVFGMLQADGTAPGGAAIRRQVAVLATLTWLLGEMPQPLPRVSKLQ